MQINTNFIRNNPCKYQLAHISNIGCKKSKLPNEIKFDVSYE